MVQMFDSVTIQGTRRTDDGYLVADVRVARTGIQEYLGTEVDPDNELGLRDKGIVRVYRPESEVFADVSLSTYAFRPVTNDHPREAVNKDNWKTYAVGQTGGEVVRDGEFVRVPMVLMDGPTISQVESGKRQLSMGYRCVLDATPGVTPDGQKYDAVQRELHMNHLAVVIEARAGHDARIGDGLGQVPRTTKEDDMSDVLKTVVLGDRAVNVKADDLATVEQFKVDTNKKISDMADTHAKAIESKDEEIGKLRVELKKAQDSAFKPEDVSKLVADRVSLEKQVLAVDNKIVTDGKTDVQLRKEAVISALGKDVVDGASDAEILGMFKAVSKDAKTTNDAQSDLAHVIQSRPVAVGDAAQQYADAVAKANANLNAHRNAH